MDKKIDMSFLDSVPLAELHTHLGFSVSPTMLWEMAHDQGLKLPVRKYFEFEKAITIYESKGYEEYIQMYDLTEKIQSSPDALFAAAQHAVSQAYRLNNITTLELRFNPVLRSRNNERDLDHLIVFCLQGLERAMLKYPVKAGIILMMDRRLSVELNDIIVQKAIKYKKRGVVGIDLAGPVERTENSRNFRPKDILKSVEKAREAGLGITVHTGEATSLDEMWEVLRVLKPDRIAHGIAAREDQKMMEYLADHNIPLDTCPTSNLHTGVVKNVTMMKQIYRIFKENRVPFTINTDGPEMNRTSLRGEYKLLLENGILNEKEVLEVNEMAHKVSFLNN